MNEGEKLKQLVMKSGYTVDEIIDKLKPAVSRKTFFSLYKKAIISDKYYYLLKEISFDVREKPNIIGDPHPLRTKGIPLYGIDVIGGTIDVFSGDYPEYIKEYKNIPGMEHCDMLITVAGKSMMDVYMPGDIIGIKEDDKSEIHYGQPYVIITKHKRLLKYIRKSSDPGKVLLISANKEGYDPMEISLHNIVKLFLVKGLIRNDHF